MPGATPSYSPEFKREAVRLVRSSPNMSVAQIARELGVSDNSLGNWVKQFEIDLGERKGLTEARCRAYPPHRSRGAIHGPLVRQTPGESWDSSFHGSDGVSPGQCNLRECRGEFEVRASPQASLSQPGGCQDGRLRLRRGILQPGSTALITWLFESLRL